MTSSKSSLSHLLGGGRGWSTSIFSEVLIEVSGLLESLLLSLFSVGGFFEVLSGLSDFSLLLFFFFDDLATTPFVKDSTLGSDFLTSRRGFKIKSRTKRELEEVYIVITLK